MRFMTLPEMLNDLRAETGVSQNVAHGVASIEPQKQLLRRVQEDLYIAHDWPYLKTYADKSVNIGDRYLALPDTFEFSGVEAIYTKDVANKWAPVEYGIGPADYNHLDPTVTADRRFPVERWNIYLQSTGDVSYRMFEIWPVPDKAAVLRIYGRRAILTLDDAGTNKSTLDGPMIVLFAAAEILARQKSEDASLKLQKALDRLKWLKGRYAGGDTRRANLAGGPSQPSLRPGIDYMPRR